MRRVGILTAGGDTSSLNATIYGAVERANQLGLEVYGFLRGYAGMVDSCAHHVHLNPLFSSIPELDPCYGGTLLGASRTYIDHGSPELSAVRRNLEALKIDALVCIGGDGTINGMQPIAEFIPCVLAPKTIDNDLGLNYPDEPNEWLRQKVDDDKYEYRHKSGRNTLDLEEIVNYTTPGYATSVFVVVQGIQRIRTTAESHRRIAIVEVMGRQSGYIALGSAYGQPDIILLPEVPLQLDRLEQRVRELYELQKHVVIVIGEGVVDGQGKQLGAVASSRDPAGNLTFSGAAQTLQNLLSERMGDGLFLSERRHEPASSVLFTRKVGHTQRGGRPIRFDRFYAGQLGGKAIDLLVQGQNNAVATLQWNSMSGFTLDSVSSHRLRDQWHEIHPRRVHHSLYDSERFQPSERGIEYLKPIFTNAIGTDDLEHIRTTLFSTSNLTGRYQSMNVDILKRVRYVHPEA